MLLLLACTGTKTGESDSAAGAAPQVLITSPADGDIRRGNFSVSGSAFDKESLSSDLQVRVWPDPAGSPDFSAWQAVNSDGSWSFTLPAQAPGLAIIEVEAEDPDGLTGSEQVTLAINDEDAPLPTFLVPTVGQVVRESSNLNIEVAITDDLSGPWNIRWSLGDGTSSVALGCDGSFPSPASCTWQAMPGNWSLYVYAEASDGLVGAAHVNFDVVPANEYDDDGDGLSEAEGDCDDADRRQGAGSLVAYVDTDGDGYGEEEVLLCTFVLGHVFAAGDCDDQDVLTHPGADEYCDGEDNDCNGIVDDNPVNPTFYYVDVDGDGEGTGTASLGCFPTAASLYGTDCDDGNAAIFTGALEYCGGVDHDCDGSTYDDDSVDALSLYTDADGDGYGAAALPVTTCFLMDGYAADATDCDDDTKNISPGATEYCDGVDNDCDGMVDEADAADASTFFLDSDGDGFGDAGATVIDCVIPAGYVLRDDDCDDADAAVNPDAVEVCDNLDGNCDTVYDTEIATEWYSDGDGDGFGDDGAVVYDCFQPQGAVAVGGDCDDTNMNINPGAQEHCNSVDDDCDILVDDDPDDGTSYYEDADGDSFGDPMVTERWCTAPSSAWVEDATDCNDRCPSCVPGGTEKCDNLDNDCNGTVDDGSGVPVVYYLDIDGDGYGLATDSILSCSPVGSYQSMSGDCDDDDAGINPAAMENCDNIDNNCDGVVDESTSLDAPDWYLDGDQDGHGNKNASKPACTQPAGFVEYDDDCNDSDASRHPGADEYCDGTDYDCDNLVMESNSVNVTEWYRDADGDGYGNPNSTWEACSVPVGYVANDRDCNDTNSDIKPFGIEVCDQANADEDCDGSADDADSSVTGQPVYYQDADGDGFGDSSQRRATCETPAGYVQNSTDCNDANASIKPGAAEVCDTVDNNCDGVVNELGIDSYDLAASNDQAADATLLNSASTPLAGTAQTAASMTMNVKFDDASDQDWFRWYTDDGPTSRSDAANTRLQITTSNTSSVPVTILIEDVNSAIGGTAAQQYAVNSSPFTVPVSPSDSTETQWLLSVVPATGWTVGSHCAATISITIREY